MRIYIGVDVGVTGAMAVMDDSANILFVSDTPTVLTLKSGLEKTVSQVDCNPVAAVEKVGAMPGQGVVSMFNFGYMAGAVNALLVCLAIPHILVTPRQWQANIIPPKLAPKQRKELSIDKAIAIYPNAWKYLNRKKDHGRADAMHLANYARKYYSSL